jgi:hypothetical protein
MTNTKNLANLAAALDDGTSGQVLTSQGSGAVAFADSTGSGVTVHANQAAMLTDAASADEGTLHYENNTNKLYVKQSSGFYLLASITNASPTIDSFSENTGGAGANNLTTGGTFTLTAGSNTVVTINATEPDLETISYSATVTSGTATDVFSSPSFPVSNQSSNVFTLTPVTSGSGGTVTIRFDASDGTNVANVSHSFEIAFQIADSHYTSLLMATDGSAGDNNDITDSSSNNHTITVNGDAHAGTFSPYRHGGYSVEFNGTNESFEPNHSSASGLGTTWSLSFWAYIPTSGVTNNSPYLIDFYRSNGGDDSFAMQAFTSTKKIELTTRAYGVSYNGVDYGLATATNLTCFDKWSYYVISHSSGTTTLYIDGSSVGSSTGSAFSSIEASSVQNLMVAGRQGGSSSEFAKMKIRDFHLKSEAHNGAVNSEPATSDSNTLILAAHKPYLAAQTGTSTALAPSVNNAVSVSPTSPYDYSEYASGTNGGSVYFDGSGDYLQLSHTGTLQLGSSDFCIEAWVYINAHKNYNYILSYGFSLQVAVGSSGYFQTWFNDTDNSNTYITCNSTSNLSTNSWNHVAISRDGNNLQCYVNGIRESTTDVTGVTFYSSNPTYAPRIGDWGGGNFSFDGYISDLRVVKGTASRTGASFTPPTAPLTAITNTSLLLSGTDAHVIDKSQVSNLKLVGDAASTSALTSGSTPPYIGAAWAGTSAVYFDGTGDRALTTGAPDLGDDFTIEAWIYSTATGNAGIVGSLDNYGSFGGSGYWGFMRNASNKLILYIDNGTYTQSTSTVPLNQWVHVACTRSSGTIYYYIDGTRDSTTVSNSLFLKNPSGIVIGSSPNNNYVYNFNGYIQDLRLTVGNVRYTAADETSNIPSAPLKG